MHNASSMVTFATISAASLHRVPWKNGGGVTREIAAHPSLPGEFDWRVSLADVDQPGPFSTFEQVDRILVMTRGEQMVLRRGDDVHRLACWEPFSFPGEAPISAHLPSGPTQDFNLMVRRTHGRGAVNVHHHAQSLTLASGVAILHCAAGSFSIRTSEDDEVRIVLEAGDTLRVDVGTHTVLDVQPEQTGAVMIDARIEPIRHARG